jgi:hypothetical protein
VSKQFHGARITSSDIAVSAENIHDALFVGFDIAGPGRVGIRISNSDLRVTEVRVSGMQTAGIEVTGKGDSVIQASDIADNPGAGIILREESRPHLDHNFIRHNGHGPTMEPGVLIEGSSSPTLFGNIIEESGAEQIRVPPSFASGTLLTDNIIAPQTRDKKTHPKVKAQ